VAERAASSAVALAAAESAPLTGRLRDDTGDRLTPTHSVKGGRRLRYYTSHRLITGGADRSGWRLPAAELEQVVANVLAGHLERAAEAHALLAEPDALGAEDLQTAAAALVTSLRDEASRDSLLRRLVASGQIGPSRIGLLLDGEALAAAVATSVGALAPSLLVVEAPLQMRRRGVELRLVAGQREAGPDATLLRALAKAHLWATAMRRGEPVVAIARRESRSETFIRRRAELAFLSPRIQAAIVEGRQPVDLTLERIVRTSLPLDWTEQARVFGLEPGS
jgi:hypothetical protein